MWKVTFCLATSCNYWEAKGKSKLANRLQAVPRWIQLKPVS